MPVERLWTINLAMITKMLRGVSTPNLTWAPKPRGATATVPGTSGEKREKGQDGHAGNAG